VLASGAAPALAAPVTIPIMRQPDALARVRERACCGQSRPHAGRS
jgi:hypothetical protein